MTTDAAASNPSNAPAEATGRLEQTNPDYDPNVVIEAQNLTKVYRDFWGRQKVRALNALDLEVRKGEIAKNERIGYLPEESYLYKFLNAEETLDFYGRLFDMPAKVRRERVQELIEQVGLGKAKRRQLKEYSKGMTRRIGLAQALINDPELILLDEPTSGLDPLGTREMKDMILKLRDEGKTIVMCSHLLADVQDVCDRVAILFQGDLKEMGRVDSLLKVSGETQIRAQDLPESAHAEIRKIIEQHGGTNITVENPTTTLEELFLGIVRDSEARPGMRSAPADKSS